MTALKFSIRSRCQPGSELLGEARRRSGGCRARRWPTACAGTRTRASPTRASGGTPGCRSRPMPMTADDLVGELGEVRVVRATAGVLVVPARGVERLALELLHARDRRELHEVEDPDGAMIRYRARTSSPRSVRMTQRDALSSHSLGLDAGVEQRVVDQAVLRRRSRRGAGGSRRRTRSGSWGRSPSPRASACRCTTRRRTSRPGTGSSTRCRRCRRPCR